MQKKVKIALMPIAPHYRLFDLAGDRNSGRRQAIMQDITGKRLAKAKCGVNAIRAELYKISGADKLQDACDAEREAYFANWLLG